MKQFHLSVLNAVKGKKYGKILQITEGRNKSK